MRASVPAHIPPAEQLGRVHFVGIGGAGLSAIARVMIARGISVSGSDQSDSSTVQRLRALGAQVDLGHRPDHVEAADTVVVSTAVRDDNPEVIRARELGVPVLPRSAALVSVTLGRRVLAVAGTHGKTTTTSLLASALVATGTDPSYAIGADLAATGSNAHAGTGDVFVIEADESDGAFLVYRPAGAVVTNVDADHLDYYGTVEAYRAAFLEFLNRIEPDGFIVVCADDPGAAELGHIAQRRGLTTVRVGVDSAPQGPSDLQARDLAVAGETSRFTVVRGGLPLGAVELQVPGKHYVLDALGAMAAGLAVGGAFEDLARGMAAYTGAVRRMQRKGEAAGVRVYDSYAHHPTEIAADLEAARSIAGSGRVIVCFQPHLVSRTKVFALAMGRALSAADIVVVTDVYLAREDPETGVDGSMVAVAVELPADLVHYVPALADVPATIAALTRPGDLVLTLGAGDVTTVGPRLLTLLVEGKAS
ncbi:MAG: UDP-N-acetylmuramate--L-alanine ligase [Nocardioidaceae bacterium]